VRRNRTGAQWVLGSLGQMKPEHTRDLRHRAVTTSMLEHQKRDEPVHTWELATLDEDRDWRDSYQEVSGNMTTDLFTVRPEDLVDLAATLMDWERIRHVPVEDDDGHLVGIVSHRALLRLVTRRRGRDDVGGTVAVKEIMRPDPVTVTPDTSTL